MRALMNFRIYVTLSAVVFAACANHGEQVGEQASPVSVPAPPKIGNACTLTDGVQPVQVAFPADVEGRGPVSVDMSRVQRHVDFHALAVGAGYCIPPGGAYPNGYYTMNCSKHADCPGDSVCDDVQCRKPCTSDHDCAKPTTCGEPAGKLAVRFCQCLSCEPHDTDTADDDGKDKKDKVKPHVE
jgi:hypothetical protein